MVIKFCVWLIFVGNKHPWKILSNIFQTTVYTYMHVRICSICICMHVYLCVCMYVCMYACTYVGKYVGMHACIQKYVCTYIHAYVHIYIHTYIQTYVYVLYVCTVCNNHASMYVRISLTYVCILYLLYSSNAT